MFEGVPAGADAYLLVLVLHNWSDEDCRRILRVVRAAMGPDAVLLIGEPLLDPGPARFGPTG
jgi:O-methyltransferase domain